MTKQYRIRRDIVEAIEEFADDVIVGPNFVIETAVQYYFEGVSSGQIPWPGPLRKRY